ncbi:unnamed protein product [Clavelina lepadiformis]|uniref:Uncharacterized protein n=1 Tax=Clavelina lepadiformis TaxID=159417 RepID=A0ABP0FX31_CLALP
MSHLRFTKMDFHDSQSHCTYSASVSPGYEDEVIGPVLEVLRSFYSSISLYKRERHQSKRCNAYEFDDPAHRVHNPRIWLLPSCSKDDLHVALIDEMEKAGWKWICPNELFYNSSTEENTTTWTFKRCR